LGLAAVRNSVVVHESIIGTKTQTATGEGLEDNTLVGTIETVLVSLNPSITGLNNWRLGLVLCIEEERSVLTGGVTRLQGEGVHEEAHEDNVAFLAIGVGEFVSRKATSIYESSIDVVEHVRPNFSNG